MKLKNKNKGDKVSVSLANFKLGMYIISLLQPGCLRNIPPIKPERLSLIPVTYIMEGKN